MQNSINAMQCNARNMACEVALLGMVSLSVSLPRLTLHVNLLKLGLNGAILALDRVPEKIRPLEEWQLQYNNTVNIIVGIHAYTYLASLTGAWDKDILVTGGFAPLSLSTFMERSHFALRCTEYQYITAVS